jgi:DNA-binding LytR/AlgR family response regulator
MENNITPVTPEMEAIISRLSKPTQEKMRFMLKNKSLIEYIESFGNNKVIHYLKLPEVKAKMNWDIIEALLPDDNFMKVQKSYFVNFDHVDHPCRVERDLELKMLNGKKNIPVSREEAKKIIEKCKKLKKGRWGYRITDIS